MADLKGPTYFLDGHPAAVLEVRDNGGHCSRCLKRGVTALLIGSAQVGARREWVLAFQHGTRNFVTHRCADLEDRAA